LDGLKGLLVTVRRLRIVRMKERTVNSRENQLKMPADSIYRSVSSGYLLNLPGISWALEEEGSVSVVWTNHERTLVAIGCWKSMNTYSVNFLLTPKFAYFLRIVREVILI
jgi:hypothetical protein